MFVNIAFVSLGSPDVRTTRMASATASPTPPVSSPVEGLTLNATIMMTSLAYDYCLLTPVGRTTITTRSG
jgi:hypothetical protein